MHADVMAGAASYTKPMLMVYDMFVLHFAARFVWKCPSSNITRFYSDNISANHMDVGVGTGYHLQRCEFPAPNPRVTLFDLNPNSLAKTSRRLVHCRVTTHVGNVLEPPDQGLPAFDSIATNYLLHCLPGTIKEKGVIFSHLKPHLNPGGVLFGTTILGEGVPKGAMGLRLQRRFNETKVFSNHCDNLADLESALGACFSEYSTEVHGAVAFFKGVNHGA
ncbi:class I SAM-dependent methyltransferase [Desulfoluna butyratoxydans]|uniref:S-adenosyl-l-methionine-dependent methyltransferase n=1 Tax=Desulfoluna butyratoxydans TaxID=231438 RepID=A0A4V6ILS9_9BACT|nr:class I SAM-dependent methyltransferase [Desulfoluna butyratoxydans]VFQ46268.1 s-adenosyl-l-methionine-dependent methyltransferase [Desulfoluna butyratoxydans]